MAIAKMGTILVTGSNGQLGSELRVLAPNYDDFDFIFADRNNFPLESESIIVDFLNANKPNVIINCAAYTSVDKAEVEQELANKVNHLAVGIIAAWCKQNKVKLIHISTDYVFDGLSAKPLTENDKTKPINYYGESKQQGEKACLTNNPNSIIIRTSWVYSEFGNNFVKTMLRLMMERNTINVVNDQIGSPTYAADLANTILIIVKANTWIPGIYNYSNEGEISWYDFALAIKKITNSKCVVNGIPSIEFPTPAKRPKYSLLDKSKIKKVYGIQVEKYELSLRVCLNRIFG